MGKDFVKVLEDMDPGELDRLMEGIRETRLPPGEKKRLCKAVLSRVDLQENRVYRPKMTWKRCAAIAACLILLLTVGFGTVAFAAEAKAYNEAVQFFDDYDLPTEGLTRSQIKAVYRDIITKSFTYAKTAEVIEKGLTEKQVSGYEIQQRDPTPQELEELWNVNYYQSNQEYVHRTEYKMSSDLGFEVMDKSYLEKYDGDTLLWSVGVREFMIQDYSVVSDGVIAHGWTPHWSSAQTDYAWMMKVDKDGNLLWKLKVDNGFKDEYIAEVLENDDGSYAVISRGDLKYFCLSQYSTEGVLTHFQKTEVGNYGIWNAACFGDGYIVQLGSYVTNEHAKIIKVDRLGNITDSFSYGDDESYYYITDMIEFNGSIYLSAYAVPKFPDEDQSAGGRYEIAAILNYLFDNEIWEISSEELTPMVRDNYTAMLLICEPDGGIPQEFYSVEGSMGGKLSISDSGDLRWDVESITETYFSPMTSAFTIGGSSCVFRYSFNTGGKLISQQETGEVTDFWR